MRLNFYLEGAGLVICSILWVACSNRYNMLDLKDRLYVYMVRIVTVLLAVNLLSCFIVRNNIFTFMWLAELIVCLSFWAMVWIWFYLNNYLIEVFYNRNTIPVHTYIIIGMPSFLNLLLLMANWANHEIFDVSRVEGTMQIVFNSWYKLPYVLVILSLLMYLAILVKNHSRLSEKKQYVFCVMPFIMLISYYMQYRFKSVASLGFGYTVILLLLYLYSYNYTARMDSLTRLPNGNSFKKMIDYRIGTNQAMTVALITLNDFKRVNYEYGCHNGRELIKAVAKYLEEVSPKKGIVRYGEDTFGVILDKASEQEITNWCEPVLERFEHTWKVGTLAHKMTVCITVVQYPDMADSSTEILELLDYLHTFVTKDRKSQCIICNDDCKGKMQRRIRISSILKDIIEDGKMYVKYQPILDVAENTYNRGEALFRLKDEVLGDISPNEFFPIAEESGYVTEMGYVLIDKVCQYIQSFVKEGMYAPIISVNFSRQQLMADDVEIRILDILQKYDLSPENIAIELPEEVFCVQYDLARQRMEQMAAHGFRFYLDGFGAGILDLSRLTELPFEIIKINKNMIKEADNNDTIYLLVSTMVTVFAENGKMILGNGIESEHCKELADRLFMNYLQGNYFNEPLTEEEARAEFVRTEAVEKASDTEQMIASAMEENEI